jgi:2-enoate reductase
MTSKKLLEPMYIGKMEIKNRIAMAPINLGNFHLPTDGTIPQRVIDYYAERARGGVGLIITGVFKVENDVEPYQMDHVPLWPVLTANALPGLRELADQLHNFGARLFVQLSAGPGRVARGDVIDAGFTPVSASPNPAYYRPHITCRALSVEDIERLIAAFGTAARMAASAGIDGVEVHGHEGYLIDQFLTPLWNQRDDKYGGDLPRRLQVAVDILTHVKRMAGDDFPVTFRYGVKHFIQDRWSSSLQADGFVEDGRDLDESVDVAKRLEQSGYDALHIDAGCYESMYWAHPPIYQPDACTVDLLKEVKDAVSIPVIAVGKLGDPHVAEQIVRDHRADMVALGRPLLADPQWPDKVRSDREEEIRPCIGCHDACFRLPGVQHKPMSCSVNPSCGRENAYPPIPSHASKAILVIGGGVAGMEVARTATQRGHHVVLFEKTSHLGGHLREACVPEFKHDLKRLLQWYERQMDLLNIEMHMESAVDASLLSDLDYDVAVLATGSVPDLPPLPGIQQPLVTTCCDVLSGQRQVGNNLIILGAGLEGCETAVWLAQGGKSVLMVEMSDCIASGVHQANRQMLCDMLADLNINILTETKVAEIRDDGIVITDKKCHRQFLACDHLIWAAGLQSIKDLYETLAYGDKPFYVIGDCKAPRNIHYAILEGFNVGYCL